MEAGGEGAAEAVGFSEVVWGGEEDVERVGEGARAEDGFSDIVLWSRLSILLMVMVGRQKREKEVRALVECCWPIPPTA